MHRLIINMFCIGIIATLAGGIGGSFQPTRILMVGLAVIALWFSPNPHLNTRFLSQTYALFIAAMVFGLLSLAWTPDVVGGTGMLIAIAIGGCALFAISRAELDRRGISLIVWSWFGSVALSVIIGFYEIATGNHFQFSLEGRVIGGAFGEFPFAAIFFGNYNNYSTWLCLAFPITLAAFFETRNILARAAVMLVNFAVIGIIFINTSRGALIYISVATALYIVRFPAVRLYAFGASILLFPVILARYSGEVKNLYDFISYRFLDFNSLALADEQRAGLIGAGLNGIFENWGLGIGIGGFEEYINDNYPYLIPNPHNILIEIAANLGIITLVLFACLIIALFFAGFRRKDLPPSLRICLMLGSIGVPLIGTIPSQAISYIYWWVWLATLIAFAVSPRQTNKSTASLQRQVTAQHAEP
jgi:O-antigen ligase